MKDLKNSFIQFIKYNIVGVMNTAVDFVIYQILVYFGMGYALAECISYGCGMLNSYFFNSRWTFKSGQEHRGREFVRFVAVNLVSLGASILILKLCYEDLGIDSDLISKGIATIGSMLINFTGAKLFVFKK